MPRYMPLVPARHPALHRKAAWLDGPSPAVERLAARMAVTMHEHRGLAIAAPQVGRSVALVVWQEGVLINPALHVADRVAHVDDIEGCLSLPGLRYAVSRAVEVAVTGIDLAGEDVELRCTGDDARMWQHEIGHLEGVMISDAGRHLMRTVPAR